MLIIVRYSYSFINERFTDYYLPGFVFSYMFLQISLFFRLKFSFLSTNVKCSQLLLNDLIIIILAIGTLSSFVRFIAIFIEIGRISYLFHSKFDQKCDQLSLPF